MNLHTQTQTHTFDTLHQIFTSTLIDGNLLCCCFLTFVLKRNEKETENFLAIKVYY